MAFSFLSRQAAKPAPLVNMPKINIQNIRVASPCPVAWNTMAGDDHVRHCSECNLNVYNLSAMTEREIQKLISNSQGRVCGRFYRRADGTILTQDCPRGLRIVARRVSRIATAVLSAVMSVGVALAGNKAKSQQPSQDVTQTEHKQTGIALTVIDRTGAVVPNAQVTVTGGKSKTQKSGVTDAMGLVLVSGLSPGDYSIEVKVRFFHKLKKTVRVHEGGVENIMVTLLANGKGETITVGMLEIADPKSSK